MEQLGFVQLKFRFFGEQKGKKKRKLGFWSLGHVGVAGLDQGVRGWYVPRFLGAKRGRLGFGSELGKIRSWHGLGLLLINGSSWVLRGGAVQEEELGMGFE